MVFFGSIVLFWVVSDLHYLRLYTPGHVGLIGFSTTVFTMVGLRVKSQNFSHWEQYFFAVFLGAVSCVYLRVGQVLHYHSSQFIPCWIHRIGKFGVHLRVDRCIFMKNCCTLMGVCLSRTHIRSASSKIIIPGYFNNRLIMKPTLTPTARRCGHLMDCSHKDFESVVLDLL